MLRVRAGNCHSAKGFYSGKWGGQGENGGKRRKGGKRAKGVENQISKAKNNQGIQ
jgi:hypothetical protein